MTTTQIKIKPKSAVSFCSQEKCRRSSKTKGLCEKHYKADYRARKPILTAFADLKMNAKRRDKDFQLTFEQFRRFAIRTEYAKKKGRKKDALHIDRIDESKGYTIDNIQVLTNTENVSKYHTEMRRHYNEKTRKMEFDTRTTKETIRPDEEDIFGEGYSRNIISPTREGEPNEDY